MTATIAYDRTVKNLIDQLSATKHVTHTAYKKTSVTIHHNGGRLSHEGVLNVWKTRPASAHFDVDSSGAVAQYVKVNEYAWAVGNKSGNQSTISIEMADATLAPNWTVADATWKSAARLAGWLFAHVVDGTPRPSTDNFHMHKDWAATDCPGPYVSKNFKKILTEAQAAYDSFKGSKPSSGSTTPSKGGAKAVTAKVVNDVIAGKYGNDPERSKKLKTEGYDPNAVQAAVNKKVGVSSPSSPAPSSPSKLSVHDVAMEVIAGKWGNGPERVRKLLAAHYNATAVQQEVDAILEKHRAVGPKSIRQVADEVWDGKWGNDPERSKKLKAAGYDPNAVQREVNLLAKQRR